MEGTNKHQFKQEAKIECFWQTSSKGINVLFSKDLGGLYSGFQLKRVNRDEINTRRNAQIFNRILIAKPFVTVT